MTYGVTSSGKELYRTGLALAGFKDPEMQQYLRLWETAPAERRRAALSDLAELISESNECLAGVSSLRREEVQRRLAIVDWLRHLGRTFAGAPRR